MKTRHGHSSTSSPLGVLASPLLLGGHTRAASRCASVRPSRSSGVRRQSGSWSHQRRTRPRLGTLTPRQRRQNPLGRCAHHHHPAHHMDKHWLRRKQGISSSLTGGPPFLGWRVPEGDDVVVLRPEGAPAGLGAWCWGQQRGAGAPRGVVRVSRTCTARWSAGRRHRGGSPASAVCGR